VGDLVVSPERIGNSRVQVELGEGGIRQITAQERPLLGGGGIGLNLRDDQMDTWGYTTDRYEGPVVATLTTGGWEVEETGPLRARVRTEGRLGDSTLRWTLTLHERDPRLELMLEVVFAERYKALQMAIQLAAPAAGWTDGLAAGSVDRLPNPAEWPVQGWSRVDLGGLQLALVTQDAYSLSLEDQVWQWTLLRAPRFAWGGGTPPIWGGRTEHTDQGYQSFRFDLRVGPLLEANALTAAARQMAQRPILFDRYEGLDRPPWGPNPPRYLWTGQEQRARQDGRMMHLAEESERTGNL
jgi:alpha-mannosidase